MSDGWEESAAAWIADLGEHGDFARRFVLDQPMLARVLAGKFHQALDVGRGEGRFCRQLASMGIHAVGIDPTAALIDAARAAAPPSAEHLAFPDGSFDLVISDLSLTDIPDIARGIHEMCRVLRPSGSLLIANLICGKTLDRRGPLRRRTCGVGQLVWHPGQALA